MILSNTQQIKFGAILSYAGIVVYILIGLLYTPWMIKVIGKDDYGLYTLAYSIISLFVFDFGISAAIQRFVAKYLAEGNKKKVNDCISLVYKLYLFVDIIILVFLSIFYFCIPYIYKELTLIQIQRLEVVYIIAAAFSFLSFPFIPLNGILSAHEKFVQLKICDLLSKVLTVLINILCLYNGGGLYELVITNVLVGLAIVVIKLRIVYKQTNIKINLSYYNRSELKDILSFSGWTTVVALSQRCIFNIAPSILGMFVTASLIGVFGIAVSLEAYTFTLAFALNGLFLPKISRILNDNDDILPLMIKVGRIQILVLGLVLVEFVTIGQDFIYIWLGNDYKDAYICTLLLIIPTFLLLPSDIADQTLIASGLVKYRAYVYIFMAIINIVLSYIMTSMFGLIGLAISIFIAYLLRTIALYYLYWSKLHINVFKFIYESYVKMGTGITLPIITSFIFFHNNSSTSWLDLLTNGIIIFLLYFISMYFLALNTSEKSLIQREFNKILKK